MATAKEVKDELETLKTTMEEEKQETKDALMAALKPLTDEITALKEQLASGSGATSADMDEMLTKIKELTVIAEGITDTPSPDSPPVIDRV